MTTRVKTTNATNAGKPWGYAVPTPEGFAAFVPLPAPRDLELGAEELRLLDRASYQLGVLAGIVTRHPRAAIIGSALLHREALASVRMSDLNPSLVDLASVEAEIPAAESADGALEVANWVAAYQLGVERLATMSLSRRVIAELHERLLAGSSEDETHPGRLRTAQTWVGGETGHNAVFVPPPVPEMATLLDDLDRFVQEEALPPLLQAAVIHFQIEAIRPFTDGNGRLSRLSVPLVLHSRGVLPGPFLSLSPVLHSRREEYEHRLMEVCAHGDWPGWLKFFLETVAAQAARATELVDAIDALHSKYAHDLERVGAPKNAHRLVDLIFATPVVTTSFVQRELSVSPATARACVATLQSKRILSEMPSRGRTKAYRAKDVIALLDPQ